MFGKPLLDYNPKFIGNKLGIIFTCPACKDHKIRITFDRWTFTGSDFTNITLSPSINVGCWHGIIEKGKILGDGIKD